MSGKNYEHLHIGTLLTLRGSSIMRGLAEAADVAGSQTGKIVYFEHEGKRIEVKAGQPAEELYRLWSKQTASGML
jgi:uncharacterized membrane protein